MAAPTQLVRGAANQPVFALMDLCIICVLLLNLCINACTAGLSSSDAEPNADAVVAWLKQACGLTDLGELLAHFSRLEAINFHLFDASNLANLRIQGLQKELQTAQVCVCVCVCTQKTMHIHYAALHHSYLHAKAHALCLSSS